jgi:CxC4 like cysteine cluster associated with KDZ transposases
MRCVSHISISPPLWCSLSSDVQRSKTPFDCGTHIPKLIELDDSSRCSCGNDERHKDYGIQEDPFIIYASTSAIQRTIQTVYCHACRHSRGRIGPDLGNFSVFNYNNRWGFSHELLNTFTSALTSGSEITFVSFHQIIVDSYLDAQSPIEFCDTKIFEYAWFGFVRLQELATSMRCSVCGPHPEVIIADGVAVSFPRHRVKELHPPTVSATHASHIKFDKKRSKCCSPFPGNKACRTQVEKALSESDKAKRIAQLKAVMDNFQNVLILIPFTIPY